MNLRMSHQLIKYACVIQLLFSIELLHLIVDMGKRQGSKNKQLKDTHVKEFELHLQSFLSTTPHIIPNEHDWKNLCIQARNQQTCTSDNRKLKSRMVRFSIRILLLLHCRLATANLLGRSWENLNCRFFNVLLC
jgi:hypothetical protein